MLCTRRKSVFVHKSTSIQGALHYLGNLKIGVKTNVIIIAVADDHGIYTMAEVEVGLLLEMNFTLYFMFRSQFAMQKVQSKVIHSCILLLASR